MSSMGLLPKGTVLHEAIKEWQRWRNDCPRRYPTLAEMPMLVSIGFEYLIGKHGKSDTAPHQAGHDAMIAEKKAQLDRAATGIG